VKNKWPYHLAVNNAERASAVPTPTMLLKYINEHKPDAINILDNKRQTALHIAVRHASSECISTRS
jgi:ankyrin repeat protein